MRVVISIDGYDWYRTRPAEALHEHKENCDACKRDGLPVTLVNLCDEGKRLHAIARTADKNRHKATPFGIPIGA